MVESAGIVSKSTTQPILVLSPFSSIPLQSSAVRIRKLHSGRKREKKHAEVKEFRIRRSFYQDHSELISRRLQALSRLPLSDTSTHAKQFQLT